VITSAGLQWKNLDWGYNPDQTLVLRLTDSTQYTILKNELARNPAILSIAGAEDHVGESMVQSEIRVGDELKNAVRYNVGAGYGESLGLPLVSGTFFKLGRNAENAQSVVINETFVQQQQWKPERAIGKAIRVGQQGFTVGGVVRDFKAMGTGAARPAMFFAAEPPKFNYLIARFESGRGPSVVADVERTWRAKYPRTTAAYFYQKDVFEGFNTTFQNLSNGFGYIAGLALLIACMGLYGLAVQHFSRRVKEVSVRKVLGATVAQIVLLVNREFLLLLGTAGLIANVVCFSGIRLALQTMKDFTGSFQPGTLSFLAANILVFLTAAIAVGIQSWKMAHVQLAETLRNNE
jgi:putative ABC transport system permease protein